MQAAGLPAIMNVTEYMVGQDDGNGQFECMHGPNECIGDLMELCAYNLTITTSQYGWWEFGLCLQTNYEDIPDNAQGCAQTASLDYNAILTCSKSKLGQTLFSQSIAIANNMGVDATPTIWIAGVEYVGGPDNPLQTVCQAYTGPHPAGCSNANKIKVNHEAHISKIKH